MRKRMMIAMIASLGMVIPQVSPPMTAIVQAADANATYEQRQAYADEQIDKYISENINDSMTQLEKLDAIAKYTASFNYDARYQSYVSMVYYGGGDCWASSNLIQHMCEMVGIKSHIRLAMNDLGSGSGHRNVAAQIDGKTYIAEAGYDEEAPRYYDITELPGGYSYRENYNTETANIYQYDGENKDLVIPSKVYKNDTWFTVTSVGSDTFDGSRELTSVTIPDSVTTINDCGFYYASELRTIKIPASVKKIGHHPFNYDYNLKSIDVDENNPYYTTVDGVLYTKDMKTLVSYPAGKEDKSFTIPSSVTTIASGAFGNMKNTKEIIVPASVKKIEKEGFYGIYEQGSTIKFLGDMPENDGTAFGGCTYPLILYPTGNATFPTEYKKGGQWQGGDVIVKSEQDLIDEENAKKAEEEAKRKAAEEEAARKKAEEEQHKKDEEELRQYIKDHYGYDGDDGDGWYDVGGFDDKDFWDGEKKKKDITDDKANIGVQFQEKGLLYKVTSAKKVKVTKCKTNAKNVTIPKTVSYGKKTYKVTSIGKRAFYGKKKLRKVTIGKNVKKIGKNAFGKTPKLKKIVLKSKVSKKQLRKAGNGKVKIVKK